MENKDHQKASRDRRKAQGLVRIELWVKPEWKQAIIEFVNKLKVRKSNDREAKK